jgi:hypothetical protein
MLDTHKTEDTTAVSIMQYVADAHESFMVVMIFLVGVLEVHIFIIIEGLINDLHNEFIIIDYYELSVDYATKFLLKIFSLFLVEHSDVRPPYMHA